MNPTGSPAFYDWLQNTALGETVRNSPILFPAAEIIHLLGLALLVGTVLAVDLSLLGIGMRRQPASRLARELGPWTLAGLVAMLVTGPLLLAADAEKISMNPVFPVKMAILVLAIAFHFTFYRRVTIGANAPPRLKAKLVGGLSLLLWVGTGFAAKVMEFF